MVDSTVIYYYYRQYEVARFSIGCRSQGIRVCSYLVSIIMIFIALSIHCSPQEATISLPSMLAIHLRLCHDCIDSILGEVLHGNCTGSGGTFRILFIAYCHSRHSSAILSQQGPVIKCLCSLVGCADYGSLVQQHSLS